MTVTEPGVHAVITLWGVRPARVPSALARMALDRRHLRAVPGLRFAKLLGTGDGQTFTLRDADPLHWGLLTVWQNQNQNQIHDHDHDQNQDQDQDPGRHHEPAVDSRLEPIYRGWDGIADERLDVRLRPIASRGRWAGRTPFGTPQPTRGDGGVRDGGPVAAITRARLRIRKAGAFWRAVPAVSADLRAADGLRLAVGIGEAPIGLQGTFSVWADTRSLTEFAYRRGPHVAVAARTPIENWYSEELFARFEVTAIRGTFRGSQPLGGQ